MSGLILFWRASVPEEDPKNPAYVSYQALPVKAPPRNDSVIYILLAGLITYVVFASPVLQYTTGTAQQIQNHALYQQSILKTDQNGETISVQPYDSSYLPETKYGGEVEDHNAYLVPDIISKDTFNGEHISEYKRRQIQQQEKLLTPTIADESQLKPMEP